MQKSARCACCFFDLSAGKRIQISNHVPVFPDVEIATQFHFRPATKRKSLSDIIEKAFSASVAGRTLPSSNLQPLNKLETNRLDKAISPHKIERVNNETISETLSGYLAAINEFLFYVEAEPFITPEKAENLKRVAFKKTREGKMPS